MAGKQEDKSGDHFSFLLSDKSFKKRITVHGALAHVPFAPAASGIPRCDIILKCSR
jgi:hypothetical protein